MQTCTLLTAFHSDLVFCVPFPHNLLTRRKKHTQLRANSTHTVPLKSNSHLANQVPVTKQMQ